MQSPEEHFVEKWIAQHVTAEGYEGRSEHSRDYRADLLADAEKEGFSKAAIEAHIGKLDERLHDAVTTETEQVMMEEDERSGARSVELPKK
ncbi:restriction endonuclease [Parvularcula dongshanensis]|uniref:DUF768 domain-containing protein n=1 Tax=Parvularcula dongshanensis TaxID=1173995 RepID=A0A840I6V0_9PROT|nr:restriction endonuclease [Parvularcula dongshanensis]MBB4659720.1 hypothetical protein [Parvularcula dongshanensis]